MILCLSLEDLMQGCVTTADDEATTVDGPFRPGTPRFNAAASSASISDH